MPEFILDHGSPEATTQFNALDEFTQGYIEAMFFTNTGSGDDGDLEHATVADLAQDAIDKIVADCAAFQTVAADQLEQAYDQPDYSPAQAGRDFWFTRNGHGVGFWDRKQLEPNGLGDVISNICGWRTAFSTIDLYRGDDGRVYL